MSIHVCEGRLCTESGHEFGPVCEDNDEATELLYFIEQKFGRKATLISNDELCQTLDELRASKAPPKKYQTLDEELREMERTNPEVRKAGSFRSNESRYPSA